MDYPGRARQGRRATEPTWMCLRRPGESIASLRRRFASPRGLDSARPTTKPPVKLRKPLRSTDVEPVPVMEFATRAAGSRGGAQQRRELENTVLAAVE